MASELDVISLAARSLQSGRWDDYESHVKAAYGASDDQIWQQLAKLHPATMNVFTALSNQPAENGVAVCQWLLPVVGLLPPISLIEAKTLLSFAEPLKLGFRHMPAEQLKPHVAARAELGRQLGEFLRSEAEPGEASISVWAGAFASGAPKEAASYAVELLTGTHGDTRLLAFLTTFLPTDSKDVQKVLASVEPSLASALASRAGELDRVAWSALCHIADHSPKARSELQTALDAGVPEAIIAIANTLYRRDLPTTGVTGLALGDLVSRLLQAGLADIHCRAHVDAAVDSLFFQKAIRPMVTQCVMDLRAVEVDVVNTFGEVFGALANHPSEFGSVLTDWLLHPDASFASIASLVSMCTGNQAPISLDESAFVAQTPDRRVKAARRLLALTHHGPTLCQFSALIAEMTTLGPERLNLAGQMLDKAFAEYPGATEEFLNAKTSILPRSVPEAHVFRGVYANALRWRRVLARLPQRKELRPSDAELQVLRGRNRRMNREIMRMAAERSIFKDIVTSMHMAQGRKFATHTKFGPPQVAEMTESSHFVELPSSERADPMRGQLERSNLLRSAR